MLLILIARLCSPLTRWLESYYLRWTRLPQSSLALGLLLDMPRARSELLLENALLRQQLIILQRQVKKPRLTRGDRLSLPLLASRLRTWKQILFILNSETLLR